MGSGGHPMALGLSSAKGELQGCSLWASAVGNQAAAPKAWTARNSCPQGKEVHHHHQASNQAAILSDTAIYHPVLEVRIKEIYSHPAAIGSRSRQDGHPPCGKCLWKAQSSGTHPATCRLLWVTQAQVTQANSQGTSPHRRALQASVNEIKEQDREGPWADWRTNDQEKRRAIWNCHPAVFNMIPALPFSKDKHVNEASEILLLV